MTITLNDAVLASESFEEKGAAEMYADMNVQTFGLKKEHVDIFSRTFICLSGEVVKIERISTVGQNEAG